MVGAVKVVLFGLFDPGVFGCSSRYLDIQEIAFGNSLALARSKIKGHQFARRGNINVMCHWHVISIPSFALGEPL